MPISGSYYYPSTNNFPPQGSGQASVGRGPIDANIINGVRDSAGRAAVNTVFGEIQASTRQPDISMMFVYGLSTGSAGDILVSSSNGGSVYVSGGLLTLSSSTSVTGTALAKSKNSVIYHPGHEMYAYFTVQFHSGAAADNEQLVGLYDSDDGYFVGLSGSRFFVGVRKDTVDRIFFSESFNIDRLDGSGHSFDSITLNPYNMNVFRISTGWLGAAPPLFSVMSEKGNWNPFHLVGHANLSGGVTTTDPHLPISAEIIKHGSGSGNLILKCGSWTAGVIDGQASHKVSERFFAFENSKSGITTETNLFTIQSKSTFQGRTNKIRSKLIYLGAANGSGASLATLRIRKNATLGGAPSYVDVDSVNSVMQVDIAGTTVVSGSLQFATAIDTNNSLFFDIENQSIFINPNDTLTFSLSAPGNVSSSISTRWVEFF